MKVEGQKKKKLKIGVGGKQQVLLQGQPTSLALKGVYRDRVKFLTFLFSNSIR